ncbi:MAG: RusA family crossover junction endodeoxyribonuclease [Candidatus Puniceispirillaceae bacterium]
MKIELFLPVPVTVNKLTHNNRAKNGGKGGRSKTARAKAWYREAQVHALPFVRGHQKLCNDNIRTRGRYWNFGKKSYDLQSLQNDHPNLSYRVFYKYYFDSGIVRDIFNFEKQLSDFLVDMGFMLDDLFIDDGRVKRMKPDAQNPRVEIEIEVVDIPD